MKKTNNWDAVLFDLDGTLLNTLEDLWSSTNYALQAMDFPARTMDEVRRFVGNGVEKLIFRAVPEGTPDETSLRCLELFRSHYNEHLEDRTKPYPGIVSMLKELKQRGLQTGVISNKYDEAVKRLCRRYFSDLVDVAVGAGGEVRKKPAPDGVKKALDQLGIRPERAVYAGDSAVDIETARNAGLVSVGVTWGFRGEEELTTAGAHHLIFLPEELLELLDRI